MTQSTAIGVFLIETARITHAGVCYGNVNMAAAIVVVWAIAVYNQLISLKNRYKNGFAQIEVQLKRRYDLIPNLVNCAKAYLKHEKNTLEDVTKARDQAAAVLAEVVRDPSNAVVMRELAEKEQILSGALNRLNITVEAYPELKADQTMASLSEAITTTENKIAFARQAFNDGVMRYNTYRQTFPNVAAAGVFGHGLNAELLEFADRTAIQEAPRVSL